MLALFGSFASRLPGHARPDSVRDDENPIRSELFSVERLEQHARSLAAHQPVYRGRAAGKSLVTRLRDNERVLLAAYRKIAATTVEGQPGSPAAEWLLDNFHLVEQQVREVRTDLPESYYRELPKLSEGPLAGSRAISASLACRTATTSTAN
jgi:cyclic beta-1,2-glucan synthetase